MIFAGAWLATKTFFAARRWILWAVLVVALVVTVIWVNRWIDASHQREVALQAQRDESNRLLGVAQTAAAIAEARAAQLERDMEDERQRLAELNTQLQKEAENYAALERQLDRTEKRLIDAMKDPAGVIAAVNATQLEFNNQMQAMKAGTHTDKPKPTTTAKESDK